MPSESLQHPKKVLVLVRVISCGKELWPIVESLRDSGRYRCVVVIGTEVMAWPKIAGDIVRRYSDAGFKVVDYSGRPMRADAGLHAAQRPSAGAPSLSSTLKNAAHRLADSRIGRLVGIAFVKDFISALRRYQKEMGMAKALIAQERPEILLMQENDNLFMEAFLTKASMKQGIPILMAPATDYGQAPYARMQTLLTNGKFSELDLRRFSNRAVALLCPQWVQTFRNVSMLRYPAPVSLAAWCLGLTSMNFWFPHSWVTKRAVLCERAQENIRRNQGFQPSQLVVTGQAVLDHVYRTFQSASQKRSEIFPSLGLNPARRTVLFSVPPLVPHGILTMPEQIAFVESILQSISELPDVQTILSLHVGADKADYAPLTQKYDAVIAEGMDVRELTALCDLFICALSSIVWTAIACQKPTLALDFWFGGHASYHECPGVLFVDKQEKVRPILHRLLRDPLYDRELRDQLKAAAPLWATCFDGRATERTVALLDQMLYNEKSLGALRC